MSGIRVLAAALAGLLLTSCYYAARVEAYKASPICRQRDGKCREYKKALKHNRKGTEPLGLRLMREECDDYRLSCEDDVNRRVHGMGVG